MLKDFSKRMVSAFFFVSLLSILIFFAHNVWFQYVTAFAVALLTTVAIWEYEQFARAKGGNIIVPALLFLGFCQVYSFFISAQSSKWDFIPIGVFFVSLLTLFALHFREKEGAILDLSFSAFGILYIAVPMGMILGTLYFHGQDGRWWVAYLIFVTKITDIGGYFVGSLIGRHKLAPHISPSKTIEGAAFGFVCALASSYLFHLVSKFVGSSAFYLGTFEWILFGTLLGITGQFSDLSESLLKRDANKKDSNKLPGLGGALDSIDSLLFNAPIIYLYLYFIQS